METHTVIRALDWLFRCGHKKLTFPLTKDGVTYVVCTRCGKEFEYSLKDMKIVGLLHRRKA